MNVGEEKAALLAAPFGHRFESSMIGINPSVSRSVDQQIHLSRAHAATQKSKQDQPIRPEASSLTYPSLQDPVSAG